jgi:signal transduction histidine kinase
LVSRWQFDGATGRDLLLAGWLILLFAAPSAAQSGPRRVLILYSFDSGFSSDATVGRIFRTELSKQSSEPITFFEASLQPTPSAEAIEERSVVNYLQSSLAGRRLDLVVTISAPAALFAHKYGELLFPETPIVWSHLDERWLQGRTLTARETAVTGLLDPAPIVEDMLRLLPQTTNVFAVIGDSPLEKSWRPEFSRRMQTVTTRVTVTWFNEQSFAEMLKRSAMLPANSVILFFVLSVDAKEFTYSEEYVLAALHERANAPMFGLFSNQLGSGVVGGPVFPTEFMASQTANVALRVLRGESAGATVKTNPQGSGPPIYDWRELRRWGISEARLPAGSLVLFRQPSVWDQYKVYIVGVTTLVGLQSALIAGLVFQRTRRRRSDLALRESGLALDVSHRETQHLAGRLIEAQDNERARVARDLHDDVSQQLAGMSIAFSGLRQRISESEVNEDLQEDVRALQQRTGALAQNVRHLSHDLHPTVLRHAGLVAALTRYCTELERTHGTVMTCRAEGDVASIAPEPALCLYRIAQEALRNVIAHAGASRADVRLVCTDKITEMTITDDGQGFDLASSVEQANGLGLVSMTERVRLAGGTVSIVTDVNKGTRVCAQIPVGGRVRIDPSAGPPGVAREHSLL